MISRAERGTIRGNEQRRTMSTVFSEQPDTPDLAGDMGAGDMGADMDLEERHALRRGARLSTELQDVSEGEYRALRLRRGVLGGGWGAGRLGTPENPLAGRRRGAEHRGAAGPAPPVHRRGRGRAPAH